MGRGRGGGGGVEEGLGERTAHPMTKSWLRPCSDVRKFEDDTHPQTGTDIHCKSKKLDRFSFDHNFHKHYSISLILSLLQTEIICSQTHSLISHFTYSLLLHYLEKCNRLHVFVSRLGHYIRPMCIQIKGAFVSSKDISYSM